MSIAMVLCLPLAVLLSSTTADAAPRRVRVGIYQNEPKIFLDENGEPSGIFVDLLESLASEEIWDLEYVPCEWSACLDSLEDGRLDLMPDVAYSRERETRFDFNERVVFQSWSRLYAPRGESLAALEDLSGKRIAVLRGSVQQGSLVDVVRGFGLDVELVGTDSFEEAFEKSSSGEVDGAVANHFYGDRFHREFGLEKTAVVFNAVDLHFAAARGKGRDLLSAIDRHLEEWRSKPGSPYYGALERWMDRKPATRLPAWLLWLLGVAAAAIVIVSVFAFLLRREVRRRTDRLEKTQEQLRQAQKMEAIGRLAGGIAHDFNNILVAIIGFSDFARRQIPDSHPAAADIDEVRKAGERAKSLTRQLLAFCRRQVLDPEMVDLNETVRGMEKMLVRLLDENIEIATDLHPDLGSVEVDPGQMEQVIMNLAVNARDAMPEGGRLTISTANRDLEEDYSDRSSRLKAGRYVMLTISDTGCGMDTETIERIFDPFFTTKEAGQGTGLGLSTVYGIVRQSGGGILVYSEEGNGTSFKVFIPRALGARGTRQAASRAISKTGGEIILVAEDDDLVGEFTSRVLREAGYEVLLAASVDDAIAQGEARDWEVDLLLTDVVMPGGSSGTDLAEELARDHPATRVLYMSGYAYSRIADHRVPGTDFLGKPFSANELLEKVRKILDAPGA